MILKKNADLNFNQLVISRANPAIPVAESIYNHNQAFWWDAARIIEDDFTYPLYEKAPREHNQRKGKKSASISNNKYGYYLRSIPADKNYSDIAADATIRNSVLKQKERSTGYVSVSPMIHILPSDIMKKVRVRKNRSLVVFAVDLSWSMAVTQRLSATKKAISTILTKVYQYRDDICLITFQNNSASIIIQPTHSVALAEKSMKDIPIGGKTPLAAGLSIAHELILREIRNYDIENITFVLLSDCDGNVSLGDGDPKIEAMNEADKIAVSGCRCIVINSDQMTFGEGNANALAKRMNASCYQISNFNADHLIKAIHNDLIL